MADPRTDVRPGSYDATSPAPASTVGRFVWHDLMTRDVEKAKAFYGALVGWQITGMPMGPNFTYEMIRAGGRDQGGIVPLEGAPPEVPSHWVGYVRVDDVD